MQINEIFSMTLSMASLAAATKSIASTSSNVPITYARGYDDYKKVSPQSKRIGLKPFDLYGMASYSFPVSREGSPRKVFAKNIEFSRRRLTVDGEERDMNDPKNIEFMERIRHYECPQEFSEPGMYYVNVLLGCGLPTDDPEYPIEDVSLEDFKRRFYS